MIRLNLCKEQAGGLPCEHRSWSLTCQLGSVLSLRDSSHTLSLPGTSVPGYRLFRPSGTILLQGLAGFCLDCTPAGTH
jgi:hypothetical protein